MKILVLGATGMAGHTIALYLKERQHNVTAYTRNPFSFCHNVLGDITDISSFISLLKKGHFDVVINCIGILNSNCDSNISNAIFINSYIPHLIAETLNGTDTYLIQMSTDCVFSGNSGQYTEDSVPDGITCYDRTKMLGEINDCKNLTFRNSIIGPDMNENGIGLFNWFMKQKESVNGFTNVIWSGVTTVTLARAIEQAMIVRLTGIYHLVNNTEISKFDLLGLFNHYFKGDSIEIKPYRNIRSNKSLVNTRNDFEFQVPSYNEMVLEMKDWIEGHSDLYPHYKN